MKAYWFTVHEQDGFPVECAALGSCDLSVLHIAGEWQWLVRQDGRDVREGAARSADDAKLEAGRGAPAARSGSVMLWKTGLAGRVLPLSGSSKTVPVLGWNRLSNTGV
jgi:hypothetical protein